MKQKLTIMQRQQLIETLKNRFYQNMSRHVGMDWQDIQVRLETNPDKLQVLYDMENTKGEPDVVAYDQETNLFVFFDCSAESPIDRRNTCYDQQALDARKANKPAQNVLDMASQIGIELLNEKEYRYLQTLGEFDLKTSSWVQTPQEVRELGGALFCDRRYNHVFLYHNGASSYYSSRGFRGLFKV